MPDEQQQTTPDTQAAPVAPTPDDGFVVVDGKDQGTPAAAEPEAADAGGDTPAKPADTPAPAPEDDLPLGAKKRVARAERQRDEMSEKLAEAQRMIDALKAKKEGKPVALDPNDFPDYAAYSEAVRKAGEGKAEPELPPVDREIVEAVRDLKETLAVVDEGLWAKFQEIDEATKQPVINNISRDMVLEMADFAAEGGDIAGKMRALAALTNEQRADIAGMSPRGVRRALREIGVAPAAAATPAPAPAAPAPAAEQARDPATGQFRKQSEAPPPISPLDGGAPAPASLEKLSTEDFIARRNTEERQRQSFGW